MIRLKSVEGRKGLDRGSTILALNLKKSVTPEIITQLRRIIFSMLSVTHDANIYSEQQFMPNLSL